MAVPLKIIVVLVAVFVISIGVAAGLALAKFAVSPFWKLAKSSVV